MQYLSQTIINHCRLILDSIYSNVNTMPYGVRWVCKTMNDLIIERFPDVSELDRNSMLGTFLFTRW